MQLKLADGITLRLDSNAQILAERGLQDGGATHTYFAERARFYMDPYVPFRLGGLKNNVSVAMDGSAIIYHMPYARRQYYENAGNGLRGAHWDKRMWCDKGAALIRELASFINKRS